MPKGMLEEYRSMRNTSNVNFTFIGYEDMEGM